MVRLDTLVAAILADARQRMEKDGAAVEAAPQGCETRRKRLAGRNLGCDRGAATLVTSPRAGPGRNAHRHEERRPSGGLKLE